MKAVLAVLLMALGAVANAPAALPDAWESRSPGTPHVQVQRNAAATARRLQAWQQRADERRAAQHAENRARCQRELRLAELCGKNAGTFYCDHKGFKPVPEGERARSAPLDRSGRFAMQRCVAEVTKHGP